MSVKGRDRGSAANDPNGALMGALARSQRALEQASDEVRSARAALEAPAVEGTSRQFSPEAITAFVEAASELLGDKPLSVESARRAGILAAAGEVWENELGPLLSSAQARSLLGDISRQRVDEMLRGRRLIGLLDQAKRRRYPAFQFVDGKPLAPLVEAYWTIADSPVNEWTAASWCVAADDALEGLSPAAWAREKQDPQLLSVVARRDAARLAQ